VFVALVNGRTDQEMKSLYTAVISFKVRTLVFVAFTEYDSGNLFIKN
jgi:hypothetical protein